MTDRKPVRREISLRTREALYGYGFILIWVVGFLLFTAISADPKLQLQPSHGDSDQLTARFLGMGQLLARLIHRPT